MYKFCKALLVFWLAFFVLCCYGENSQIASQLNKVSTAQPNVLLLKDQLDMPGLNRERQIRIYLPPHYAESNKHYPVLYMHDAQNLFDVATAYASEWKVDETLNALSKSNHFDLIVVGIDNGQDKRMAELNPWHNKKYGAAEGNEYMEFIVKVVKPMIDQQYRTLADRENTAIMGSSMGGLITHYAIVKYPKVFSKAGIFSPSYWAANDALGFFATTPAAKDARLYFYIGAAEGASMVPDVKKVYESVLKSRHPSDKTTLNIVPGADHSETAWSNEFARSVLWLFQAGR